MPENKRKHPVTGILLAAGQGTRFGGDKCLAPLPDGTALGLRAAQNLAVAVGRLICVVRAEDEVLRNLFLQHGFEVVVCADAESGMSASIRAGVGATTPPSLRGRGAKTANHDLIIALADMPLIKPATCQHIANSLVQHGGIVVPAHNGQRGHPVGFSGKYRDALLQLKGDQGARPLITEFADDVTVVPVDDHGICQDFDTRAELQEFNAQNDAVKKNITQMHLLPSPALSLSKFFSST